MAGEAVYPYEDRLEDFMRIVRMAQQTIAAQVRAALDSGDAFTAERRRLQLAAVQATLDRLAAEIDPLAGELVRDAYQQAADQAAREIRDLQINAPEVPGAFAGVSSEAIATLQESITGRLGAARDTVGRTINDTYARAGRRATVRAVLGAEGSPRAAARQLRNELLRDRDVARMVRDGGFGFVDSAGKRWNLDTYSEMAVRTTTREAVVQGAIARMASHNITIARVSRHGDSCQICLPWQGRLVSLDGTTTDYQGEAISDLGALPNGGPPFHPNCRHSLQPVSTRIEDFRRERAAGIA